MTTDEYLLIARGVRYWDYGTSGIYIISLSNGRGRHIERTLKIGKRSKQNDAYAMASSRRSPARSKKTSSIRAITTTS